MHDLFKSTVKMACVYYRKDVYKYKGYLNLSKQYTGRLKLLGRPTVKGILLASIPSALGFLACAISVIINIDS